MFWRPSYEWRGTRAPWFTSESLNRIGMSELAAKTIYAAFNLFPIALQAANDRDGADASYDNNLLR